MNEFLLLKDHFQDKFPDEQIDFIQYSRSPEENDSIHFLLFLNNRISYIISTYRKDSYKRLSLENKVMKQLLNKIECSDQINSILYTKELIKSESQVFKFQKYVDNTYYRRKLKGLHYNFLLKLINHSTLWIEKLQSANGYNYSDSFELVEEASLFAKQLNENKEVARVFVDLKDRLYQLKSPLKKSFSHGDYCPYNYCFNRADFFVFDWEYASNYYWAFYDPILNFITIWIMLFSRKMVKDIQHILSNEKKNKYEILLNNYAYSIIQKHKILPNELKSLIVFVYLKNQSRKESHKILSDQAYSASIIQLLY